MRADRPLRSLLSTKPDPAGGIAKPGRTRDPERLFCFEGLHAYADQYVWSVIEAKLMDLRTKGALSVSILDIGCGPGTWLRRLVTRAKTLGFTSIAARGFDVA